MDRSQGVDRLDLDHDEIVDQKIKPQADIHANVAVGDGHANLTLNAESPTPELFGEAGLVDRFQQARPQCTVHCQCGVHDDTPDALDFGRQWLGPFVSFVHPL